MRKETVETTYYTYEELSEKAKDHARDKWREDELQSYDNFFAECVIDDAAQIADIIGIDLRQTRVNLMGGGHRYEPTIYWRGFWSQGDGACFEGRYTFKADAVEKLTGDGEWVAEPLRIARELEEIQKRYNGQLWAAMKQRGHYSHSGCMSVDVDSDAYDDDDENIEVTADDEEAVRQLMRSYADWIYKRLEEAYEWHISDENVAENIIANEYEFDEDGNRL